jgi:hypothetical protein
MKIIITEEEKNRILHLYESTDSDIPKHRKRAVYVNFVKNNGFKLECSNCDSSPIPKSTKKIEVVIQNNTERTTYPGEWNNYYKIINNKNSCSEFPISISGYDPKHFSFSYPINNISGDALIVATFDEYKPIIFLAKIILCAKLYFKSNIDEFFKLYKSNIDNSSRNEEIGGYYEITLINLQYSTMEQIIDWLSTNHKPTTMLDNKHKNKDDLNIDNVS